MKTAKQVLVGHDCMQSSLIGLPERIISIDVDRFVSAMHEYAKQVAEQALKDASENHKDDHSSLSAYEWAVKRILNTEIKLL